MMVTTKLIRVGNSTGLTLPQGVLAEAGLRRGDDVAVCVSDGRVAIAKADSAYNRAMTAGRAFARRYRTALAILAR